MYSEPGSGGRSGVGGSKAKALVGDFFFWGVYVGVGVWGAFVFLLLIWHEL